jgi:hypothetical protein
MTLKLQAMNIIIKYIFLPLFIFFIGIVGIKAKNPNIDSLLNLITPLTYSAHFDSLRTDSTSTRKVQTGQAQSTDHDACRDYIYRQFRAFFGKENTHIHHFEKNNYRGLANVTGFKRGTNPDAGIWIVGAHYDSNNSNEPDFEILDISPGANDNGTGVAAVLEIARVISGIETEASILFAAWDFEEIFTGGLPTGSNEWYRKHVKLIGSTNVENPSLGVRIKRRDINAYINFDMFGNPADSIDDKPVLWVCYAMKTHNEFANEYAITLNKYLNEIKAIPYGPMTLSDHFTFAYRRIPSIENLQSGFLSDKYYHTRHDHINQAGNIDMDFASHVTQGGLVFLILNVSSPSPK